MRIIKISVTKLFGIFDHIIPLNIDERITIIHGKNGVGKTSLLKLINGFFNLKYSEIKAIPFEKFKIDFDDGSHVTISKSEAKNKKKKYLTQRIHFDFVNSQGTSETTFSPSNIREDDLPFSLNNLEDIIPNLRQLDSRRWLYTTTKEVLDSEQVLERFEEFLPFLPEQHILRDAPDWLRQVRDAINVRFIESQRLLNSSEDFRAAARSFRIISSSFSRASTVPSVTTYAQDLADNIQSKLAEYGNLSQTLDRTFPIRVVQKQDFLTDEELKNKLDALEKERKELIAAGLLKSDENANFSITNTIDDSTKKLLSVYVGDVEQKLKIFQEIAPKIELFKRIINSKFSYSQSI